jgi:hypothetical protein
LLQEKKKYPDTKFRDPPELEVLLEASNIFKKERKENALSSN